MTSEHGGKVDHGPLLESMYTACSTHLTTGLACTLSLTRQYMKHGGHLPANCALTVYYLPVYPPYSDYNYGLRWLSSRPHNLKVTLRRLFVTDKEMRVCVDPGGNGATLNEGEKGARPAWQGIGYAVSFQQWSLEDIHGMPED
jgi:hypothetical protein